MMVEAQLAGSHYVLVSGMYMYDGPRLYGYAAHVEALPSYIVGIYPTTPTGCPYCGSAIKDSKLGVIPFNGENWKWMIFNCGVVIALGDMYATQPERLITFIMGVSKPTDECNVRAISNGEPLEEDII